MHRTPELPAHSLRLAVSARPARRRGTARSQAQEFHPGVAGVDTAGASRAVGAGTGTGAGSGTGTGAGAREAFELLRQVRHPLHRRRQVLPGMRSPNGVLVIPTEIPTAITDLRSRPVPRETAGPGQLSPPANLALTYFRQSGEV